MQLRARCGIKSLVQGNTTFALDLYQKLAAHPGNLFFSPYSISTALAMTCAGARARTESEMARALHFNLPGEKVHTGFGILSRRTKAVGRWNRITLTTADSLWCQQGEPFAGDFLELIRRNYDGEVHELDFSRAASAANEMNEWAERNTRGKIKGAIDPGRLTNDTRLVLCDAIYFKGKWQKQFDAKQTVPKPFYIATNQTVTVPMMSQNAGVKMTYINDPATEMLELPYSGTDLSMIILLPVSEDFRPGSEPPGLGDLERKLTGENLLAWLARLDRASPGATWVGIPRFTFARSIDLTDELKSLGISSAFKPNADFSGMKAGSEPLFISEVIHKGSVEVNEQGTEAAAVTWVEVRTCGMNGNFYADHPFIFLIRDNGSGTILFLGRVVDPTK